MLFLGFGKPFSVRAPACGLCGWGLHLRRIVSVVLTLGLVFVMIWYVWPLVSHRVPRGLRKWAAAGLALLGLAPLILYEAFWPHPFNLTAFNRSVDYEFRDEGLAYEFAELNESAKWVKIG